MKLAVQLLDTAATLNRFKKMSQIEIAQGETVDLFFQLIDKEQGIRYIPASGATVKVEMPRFPEAFSTVNNVRDTIDYSIRRNATAAFPSDDRSIWKLPLLATDTENMMSTHIRVTVTEGSKVSIAVLTMAIQVTPAEA